MLDRLDEVTFFGNADQAGTVWYRHMVVTRRWPAECQLTDRENETVSLRVSAVMRDLASGAPFGIYPSMDDYEADTVGMKIATAYVERRTDELLRAINGIRNLQSALLRNYREQYAALHEPRVINRTGEPRK